MGQAATPYLMAGSLGLQAAGLGGGKKGGGGNNSVSTQAYHAELLAQDLARQSNNLLVTGEPLRVGVAQNLMNELGYKLPGSSFNANIYKRLGLVNPSSTGSGSANLSPLRDATESSYTTASRQLMESSANRGGALNYNLDQLMRGRASQLGQNRLNLLNLANTAGYAGVNPGIQGNQSAISGELGVAGIAQQGQMQQAQLAQQNAMMAGQGKGNLLGLSLIAGKGNPNQQTGTGAFTAPYAASNFKLNPSYSGLPQLSRTY